MATRSKVVPMCIVTINYQDFILPFAQGMKLVELMQNAVGCSQDVESDFSRPRSIVPDQPTVAFSSIKPDQLPVPSASPRLTHR